jgi:hypothetical protein
LHLAFAVRTLHAWTPTPAERPEFSSGAGGNGLIVRKAVMPAPSAATAGSAARWSNVAAPLRFR